MIGIIIITHFGLAEKFLEAAEIIAGQKPAKIAAISIDSKRDVNEIREQIKRTIKKLDTHGGVLILTDMFGGTPCNMSLAFLEEGKVEVLTGINLPMLIEAIELKDSHKSLSELAQSIQSFGQKNICLASEILYQKSTDAKG